jgi:hydroxymethylbilane synthase
MNTLRIGTRGSQLALWQANTVKRLLAERGHQAELVIIKTTGDRLSEQNLSEAGGKRLFVKEIEEAMLRNDIDLAVHSAKDMPAELAPGLTVAAVLPREDPRDALVLPTGHPAHGLEFDQVAARLGPAPVVGTSSVRRIAQLLAVFPGARFEPVRGNVDTRLRKLDGTARNSVDAPERPEYHALVLAAAGLRRLGLGERVSALIPIETCIPAPGQGTIAIEIREGDEHTRRRVSPLNDEEVAYALEAERTLVAQLGGGCQLPLGGIALPTPDGQLQLSAIVISTDGRRILRRSATGEMTVPYAVGGKVARMLLEAGAAEILDEVRTSEE